jgi:hypothetical protein
MELVNQHVKGIMEECKIRARDVGLKFDDETLEYIITNRDMIKLSPKVIYPHFTITGFMMSTCCPVTVSMKLIRQTRTKRLLIHARPYLFIMIVTRTGSMG